MVPVELESVTVEHPSGLVTLVFTDIESSSELSERYGPAFESVRNAYFSVLREAAGRWNGYEVETAGDALFLVFAQAEDAANFAVDAQQAIARYPWPPEISTLHVRIGMHSGEPYISEDKGRLTYRGPATNRASRVVTAAHGEQILLSDATRAALGALPPDAWLLDCGVHRLRGVGEEHLWQLCHLALRRDFPPLNTLTPERHNLPLHPTPFVGREEEIAAWHKLLLQPETRLLTLCGFGGMGKTRSALYLAEACIANFKQGIWWVELAEAHNAGDMLSRVAVALRLAPQPQLPLQEQIKYFLREREILLVLDNTEQIPDAAGVIHELLLSAPHLKCLVTSRQTLALGAEVVRDVPPLSLEEAQRLFTLRAQARCPDFEITSLNAADITEICRRLEGVPLALELAAGRCAGLSPREILAHLNQRFLSLQSRSPDLPARQRALRGTMDWSYELLAADEQALFAELAVFVHGFTMEDALAVCSVSDPFEAVLELRRQSLLFTEAAELSQQTRYFMLETVRAYAGEKLAASNDEAELRLRHAEYFAQFIEARIARLRARDEVETLAQLEPHLDNVRAALDWSHRAGEAELCVRLALALGAFLRRRGLQKEAVVCIHTGFECAQQLEDKTALLAGLWRERAGVEQDQLEWNKARQSAQNALELFTKTADARGKADAHNLIGLCNKHEDNLDAARSSFGHALEIYRQISDDIGLAIARNNLGLSELEIAGGDLEAAARELNEALRLRRACGDRRGMAETLNNLGVLAQKAGALDEAQRYYEEALRWETELSYSIGVARVLYNLGEVAQAQGQIARALRLSIAAQSIFDAAGSPLASYPACLAETLVEQMPTATVETLRADIKDKSLLEVVRFALDES